jgi:hypothetical protein
MRLTSSIWVDLEVARLTTTDARPLDAEAVNRWITRCNKIQGRARRAVHFTLAASGESQSVPPLPRYS